MSLLSLLFGSRTNKGILLTPEEFNTKIKNKKIQLIDVRTAREFYDGHIIKAKNIDFYSRDFVTKISKLKKNQPIYLYCRTGARSRHAANKMGKMDFVEVYDLQGGISNWYRKNFKIIK